MLTWSKAGATLAVGTSKGNLQLFHSRERRLAHIVGKHTKRVACGVWNKAGALAMAALDKMVSTTRLWALWQRLLALCVAKRHTHCCRCRRRHHG